MFSKSLYIYLLIINIQISYSQTMNELTLKYDRILTDNFDITVEYLEKEISDTESLFLKLMLPYVHIKTNNVDKGSKLLADVKYDLKDYPYLNSLYEMGKALIEIERENESLGIEMLKNAIKIDIHEENKWARVELFLLLKEEIPFEAWKYLEEALKIDPKFYWALVEKSYEFDSVVNCNEIVDNLSQLPKSYNDHEAVALLGVAYLNCKNFDEAKAHFERSIRIKESTNNFLYIGELYHEYYKDYDKAESFYKKSLELDSSNIETVNAYSWLLYDREKHEEAEKKIISMLEIAKDQEAYNQIMNFFLLTENISKAKEYLRESVIVNNENYMNNGYRIIIKILEGNKYKDLFESYKTKYQEYDVHWLRDQIAFFLENRNN
jgi:tetratricopeptide (TPR) repeat protein